MKKIAAALFVTICAAVVALPASADSYTLNFSTGTGNVGGVEIFPYMFSSIVDNTKGGVAAGAVSYNVDMMCIDFQRNIVAPETWTATGVNITTPDSTDPAPDGPFTAADLRALAILDAQIATATSTSNPDISDLQFAAWRMTASASEIASNPGFNGNSLILLNNAIANAADPSYSGPGSDYSDYIYFDPTSWGTSGITAEDPSGIPQRFIVFLAPNSPIHPNLTPTPEPSSLALLGTGVLGIAGITRRRFFKA